MFDSVSCVPPTASLVKHKRINKLIERQRKSYAKSVKAVSTDMCSDTVRCGDCEVKENPR